MLDFIAKPLGQFLYFIYNTIAFENYGVAIIIFTVIIKLILLPLTIKQYRSTAKMQELQPLIQEIQKKYKNDKEKLNQELMKIYQENNANPAGGCLPLLIQMPILFSLFYVITQPLKFMLSKTPEQIQTLIDYVSKQITTGFYKQIDVLNYFSKNPEALSNVGDIFKREELISMNFLGLNLSMIPKFDPKVLFGPEAGIYLPLLLIPILGVVTTYISSKMSMPPSAQKDGQKATNSAQNSMLYVGPIMTLIFSFQLPAGVGIYWIAGYVFQIFQQLYINKHVIKKKEVATK